MTLTGPALWWRLLVIGGLWGCSFPLLRLVAAEVSPSVSYTHLTLPTNREV
mgnify:CR=1 FL=1